jgi:hypothetical protein
MLLLFVEDPDPDWKEDADPFDRREELDDDSAAERAGCGESECDGVAPCLLSPVGYGIDGCTPGKTPDSEISP